MCVSVNDLKRVLVASDKWLVRKEKPARRQMLGRSEKGRKCWAGEPSKGQAEEVSEEDLETEGLWPAHRKLEARTEGQKSPRAPRFRRQKLERHFPLLGTGAGEATGRGKFPGGGKAKIRRRQEAQCPGKNSAGVWLSGGGLAWSV